MVAVSALSLLSCSVPVEQLVAALVFISISLSEFIMFHYRLFIKIVYAACVCLCIMLTVLINFAFAALVFV